MDGTVVARPWYGFCGGGPAGETKVEEKGACCHGPGGWVEEETAEMTCVRQNKAQQANDASLK